VSEVSGAVNGSQGGLYLRVFFSKSLKKMLCHLYDERVYTRFSYGKVLRPYSRSLKYMVKMAVNAF
jgi:hypothetical protein